MFNMGGGELALVALVALLILGPKKLPQVATTLGRWIAQLQRGFEEVKGSVNASLREDESKKISVENKIAPPLPRANIKKKETRVVDKESPSSKGQPKNNGKKEQS